MPNRSTIPLASCLLLAILCGTTLAEERQVKLLSKEARQRPIPFRRCNFAANWGHATWRPPATC